MNNILSIIASHAPRIISSAEYGPEDNGAAWLALEEAVRPELDALFPVTRDGLILLQGLRDVLDNFELDAQWNKVKLADKLRAWEARATAPREAIRAGIHMLTSEQIVSDGKVVQLDPNDDSPETQATFNAFADEVRHLIAETEGISPEEATVRLAMQTGQQGLAALLEALGEN